MVFEILFEMRIWEAYLSRVFETRRGAYLRSHWRCYGSVETRLRSSGVGECMAPPRAAEPTPAALRKRRQRARARRLERSRSARRLERFRQRESVHQKAVRRTARALLAEACARRSAEARGAPAHATVEGAPTTSSASLRDAIRTSPAGVFGTSPTVGALHDVQWQCTLPPDPVPGNHRKVAGVALL